MPNLSIRAAAASLILFTTAPADAETDSEKQLSAAQQAYVSGDYQKAIDLARPLTEDAASGKRAWRIVGASACQRKDAALAGAALKAVDATSKQFIRYVCQKTGTQVK